MSDTKTVPCAECGEPVEVTEYTAQMADGDVYHTEYSQ